MGGVSLLGAVFLLTIPASADLDRHRVLGRVGHGADAQVDRAL